MCRKIGMAGEGTVCTVFGGMIQIGTDPTWLELRV